MSLITYAQRRLSEGGVENALQEGRWMVEELLKREKGAPSDDDASLCVGAQLEEWLKRRLAGEPFQYILGSVEFYDVELSVGPGVLIPRPETEVLVDHALRFLRTRVQPRAILDLCTGSGAIALSIAHALPDAVCTGVDLSIDALRWAQGNLAALRLPNCRFLQGDLFSPLQDSERFDLITANPPYVSPKEYAELPDVVKCFEPRLALEAAEDGLFLERAIIREARRWLKPGGAILLEMGETQGAPLLEELRKAGFPKAELHRDLAGKPRIVGSC